MNTGHQKEQIALVICQQGPVSGQAVTWLERQGYICRRIESAQAIDHPDLPRAALLLADISHTSPQNIDILQRACQSNPTALRIPLCRGGNSPAMRMAREIGVDGYLYLVPATDMIDFQRGFATTCSISNKQRRLHYLYGT